MCMRATQSGGGMTNSLLAASGFGLDHQLIGALDRRDVVDARGQDGADGRVVVVVDEQLGRALVLGGLRDHQVVGPEHPALGRQVVLERGQVDRRRGHVARPRHRQHRVARGEVRRVRLALDVADDAVVLGLLHHGHGRIGVGALRVGGVEAEVEHREPHRVAHLGQVLDLALGLGIDRVQRGEAGHVARDVGVEAEARGARTPRGVLAVGRVPRQVAVDVLEVGDEVGHVGRVERVDPAAPDQLRRHPVGERDQVPARVLAGLRRVRDLGDELVVAVHDLLVADLRAVLRGERLERRMLRLVVRVRCPCSTSSSPS